MTGGEKEEAAIARIYAAFGRRDLAALTAELHRDAQIDLSRSVGPESGLYPGVEGIQRLLDLYWGAFSEITIEPERLVTGDDGIVALVVARGIGRGSGVSVEARGPHLWRFRDGSAILLALYQDEGDALAAAGVPPPR